MDRTAFCRPRLLVSIRNREEAIASLQSGVEILDCKEPTRGALGRVDASTLRSIVEDSAVRTKLVNESVLVTAAWGELIDAKYSDCEPAKSLGLAAIKIGFAGEIGSADLRDQFAQFGRRCGENIAVLPVAYADHELAEAPMVEEVARLAIDLQLPMMLIDTFSKGRGRLWDWLDKATWRRIREECHQAGVRVALAGSLTAESLGYEDAPPDVVGIRGAACVKGMRTEEISGERIREFKRRLVEYSAKHHEAPDVVGR